MVIRTTLIDQCDHTILLPEAVHAGQQQWPDTDHKHSHAPFIGMY